MCMLCSCGGGGGGSESQTTTTAQTPIQTSTVKTLAADEPNNSAPNNWVGGLKGIWNPTIPIKGYVIIHQGHSAWSGGNNPEYDLTPMAEAFLNAGYRVYAFEMPPMPHNYGPVERFYKPVINLLDKIAGDGYPTYMVGFSGGAWTTTNATALDSRIKKGYSIQGDCPLYIWEPKLTEWDEYVSTIYPFFTLYQMAGDRLLHIYGKKNVGPYGFVDRETAGYPIVYDDTATTHEVTPWAIDYILGDINAHSNSQASANNI